MDAKPKAEHTPGPWRVDLESGEIEAGATVIGTIYGTHDYPCCDEDITEECAANARLIAAAPDLLAACKNFASLAANLERGSLSASDLKRGVMALGNQARAAIQAAAGR